MRLLDVIFKLVVFAALIVAVAFNAMFWLALILMILSFGFWLYIPFWICGLGFTSLALVFLSAVICDWVARQ